MQGDNEMDAINFMHIGITLQEFETLKTVEVHKGSNDANFDELIGAKEEVPTGTAESTRLKGKTRLPKINEEDLFDYGPGGEIIERD
jgi:hypothetical protein